ncbi:hypothetical protein VCHA53O466_50464 [Vibrio chagasii]|nr:hypothetical protein VCHA53O466_50464 [Vibrio chagasii]
MTALLDLTLAVLDRGGGLGVALLVVVVVRLRVTVAWSRAHGLRVALRF